MKKNFGADKNRTSMEIGEKDYNRLMELRSCGQGKEIVYDI